MEKGRRWLALFQKEDLYGKDDCFAGKESDKR